MSEYGTLQIPTPTKDKKEKTLNEWFGTLACAYFHQDSLISILSILCGVKLESVYC